ncbi:unnamed protein product [Pedinophyceae sp. YPF-701]|nr:unnamed protein product [Pedinophyceae sp. YPF-701]
MDGIDPCDVFVNGLVGALAVLSSPSFLDRCCEASPVLRSSVRLPPSAESEGDRVVRALDQFPAEDLLPAIWRAALRSQPAQARSGTAAEAQWLLDCPLVPGVDLCGRTVQLAPDSPVPGVGFLHLKDAQGPGGASQYSLRNGTLVGPGAPIAITGGEMPVMSGADDAEATEIGRVPFTVHINCLLVVNTSRPAMVSGVNVLLQHERPPPHTNRGVLLYESGPVYFDSCNLTYVRVQRTAAGQPHGGVEQGAVAVDAAGQVHAQGL